MSLDEHACNNVISIALIVYFNLLLGGYSPAAAAAAAAFAAQNRQVRGKGRGYLGNYPGMLGEFNHFDYLSTTHDDVLVNLVS